MTAARQSAGSREQNDAAVGTGSMATRPDGRGRPRPRRRTAGTTTARLAAAFALLGLVSIVQTAWAQTATTRAPRTIYTTFGVYGNSVELNGQTTPFSTLYGYVKFDVEASEPSQGKLSYRVVRMQPVSTFPNSTLSITQQGCVLEDNAVRFRCFYTVKTTLNMSLSSLKQTATYKINGSGSASTETPTGSKWTLEGGGEQGAETAFEVKPGFSFSRSFEFSVQRTGECDKAPDYSVYTVGRGSTPKIVPSKCATPPKSVARYCGRSATPNYLPNGQIDGHWYFTSETPADKTLRTRTYTLHRGGQATKETSINSCSINMSSAHVFEAHDWQEGRMRMSDYSMVSTGGGWCRAQYDLYYWDERAGSYSVHAGRFLGGGLACPGSNLQPQPVYQPSMGY